jgi:hypothetical protein
MYVVTRDVAAFVAGTKGGESSTLRSVSDPLRAAVVD